MSGECNPNNIRIMTDIINYRGPDDYGYLGHNNSNLEIKKFKEKTPNNLFNVFLGHRRLSIIDLSEQGHQPMSYNDEKLWMVLNGEIYNYIELREELVAKGYQFRSRSDTEVVLAAYMEWGVNCLNKFNGMWSFALLDTVKQQMFCARDRLGIKPFYYHFNREYFSFGSEMKQLLTLPWVDTTVNTGVVFDYLTFSSYGSNSEQTVFENIMDLRGGHYLLVPLQPSAFSSWYPEPAKWWDIDLSLKLPGLSDQEYASRYYELLYDSVKLRLRSDVPVGTCLSGGLDSSGIACLVDMMMKSSGISGMQKTFTAISSIPRFDETEYAKEIINVTNAFASFVEPTFDGLLKDMRNLIWHQEEPFLSTSIFAGWTVYQLVKAGGVTVSLDGQGPDEILGGYKNMPFHAATENFILLQFSDFLKNYSGLKLRYGYSDSRIWKEIMSRIIKGKVPIPMMGRVKWAKGYLSEDFFEEGLRKSVYLKKIREKMHSGNFFDRELYHSAKDTGSLPGILRQVDRNSMAFSIEARVPFLDYRLVEYSFSLPSNQKIRNGITKYVYRNAMKGVIPEKILSRKSKLGFVTAEADWLKDEARVPFFEIFSSISESAWYKKDAILSRFNAYQSGKLPYSNLFWQVVNLEIWKSCYSV